MIGQPSNLRKLNQHAMLRHLFGSGAATRAQIAKTLGLSPPTVGKVAEALLAAGVLEEVTLTDANTAEPATLGRPGVMLRVDQTTPRLILLQLGVRHTRLAAVPLAGQAVDQWQEKFVTPKTPATIKKRLQAAAKDLKLDEPWAVMVSTPGVVDETIGRVLLSPNLHWTSQVDLPALIREVWNCQVHLVQEIRALALGHQKTVAASASTVVLSDDALDDFLLVDVGQGVGAAAVVGGRLFASSLPLSGELGHTPVAGNKRMCGCGGTGCLETLLSRKGLLQNLNEAMGRKAAVHDWSAVLRQVESTGMEPWLAHTLDAGARLIAGAMNMLGMKRVIVTGALAELGPVVLEELHKQIESHAMWGRFGSISCQGAPRHRAAGLMEAAISRVVLAEHQPWELKQR